MVALASLGLVACNEDFPGPDPQSNLPESLVQVSDVTAVPLIDVVDINAYLNTESEEYIDGKNIAVAVAKAKEGAMPKNTNFKAVVEFSTQSDFANPLVIDALDMANNDTVFVSPEALQNAYYSSVTHSPKAKTMYVRTSLRTLTNGTSEAIIGGPTQYFAEKTITLTPRDMHIVIEPAYYYLGSLATDQTYKFTNSGADVYDDPVFTCVIPASGADWHWFKIAPESAYNADGTIDWGKEESCICPVKGDDDATEGKCENGKKSWHLLEAEGVAEFKITVNVMDMTYSITPIYAVAEYYIVGRQNNWSMSKVSAMYPTSGTTMTYTSYFTNAWDCRIATPENAAAGTWDHDFGAATNGCTDATGTLLANSSNCIASPGVGYYTLKANLKTMTYEWEAVEGTPASYEKIGLVGAGDDWDNDIFLTKVEGSGDLGGNDTHNWSALGVELKAATWGVKFRANAGWDVNWGTPNITSAAQYTYGTGTNGGDNIQIHEAGTYNIYFNDITGQFFFIKL